MKLNLISICLSLCLLVACNKRVTLSEEAPTGTAGSAGTAEGFGGDPFYTDKLNYIRDTLLKPALSQMNKPDELSTNYCDFAARCADTSNPLCPGVITLNANQRNLCATFLSRNLPILESQLSNPDVVLQATYDTLQANGTVAGAMTSLSSTGKIYVNIDYMKNMNDLEIAAVLMHEYLHKIEDSQFGFIQDLTSYDQGLMGATLNTTAGQEVAFQARGLKSPELKGLTQEGLANGVRLSWIPAAGSNQVFQIAYAIGAYSPGTCRMGEIIWGATIGNATTFDVTGLARDTTYTFRVCGWASDIYSTGLVVTSRTLP